MSSVHDGARASRYQKSRTQWSAPPITDVSTNRSAGWANSTHTVAPRRRAIPAARRSPPRAPPQITSESGPTPHLSKHDATRVSTDGTQDSGKRGAARPGASVTWPVTTTTFENPLGWDSTADLVTRRTVPLVREAYPPRMIFGTYRRQGGVEMPRVVTISVSPDQRPRASTSSALDVVVRVHEEGTCFTLAVRRRVSVAAQAAILAGIDRLDAWTEHRAAGLDPASVRTLASRTGRRLFDAFLGREVATFLDEHPPTALMIDIDESIVGLPWELLDRGEGPLALSSAFGRIVTLGRPPRPARDPVEEDRQVSVLVVSDPRGDLPDAALELAELGTGLGDQFVLTVLERGAASRSGVFAELAGGRHDIVHVSTHGHYDPLRPANSGLVLADGVLTTSEILAIRWERPPYLVYTDACWSGRSASNRRFVGRPGRGANGVAGAFLGAGVSAFVGFYWPVGVRAGAALATEFYGALLDEPGVGDAFHVARQRIVTRFAPQGDLSGLAAIFYGDAATGVRRGLAEAS